MVRIYQQFAYRESSGLWTGITWTCGSLPRFLGLRPINRRITILTNR